MSCLSVTRENPQIKSHYGLKRFHFHHGYSKRINSVATGIAPWQTSRPQLTGGQWACIHVEGIQLLTSCWHGLRSELGSDWPEFESRYLWRTVCPTSALSVNNTTQCTRTCTWCMLIAMVHLELHRFTFKVCMSVCLAACVWQLWSHSRQDYLELRIGPILLMNN